MSCTCGDDTTKHNTAIMERSIVRVTGAWHYEKTSFFSRSVEKVEKESMLEFLFEHHPRAQQDETAPGQCAATSQIRLYAGSSVPPPLENKSPAAKVVAKQREDATRCVIRFYELISFSIGDEKQTKDMLANTTTTDENGNTVFQGNSLTSMRDPDSAAVLAAASQPFTIAITFAVRAPGGSKMKGTEDLYATPKEKDDSDHAVRTIKFVVTALAASGGGDNASSSPSSTTPSSAPMSLRDRIASRVQAPIDSFLMPHGRLHIFPLVSPVSGKGAGVKLFEEAQKIFRRCQHTVHPPLITKYRGHAEDWVANSNDYILPPDDVTRVSAETKKSARRSVIVAFGGDGMLHEAINGWFRREIKQNGTRCLTQTEEAYDERPIFVPFPTGSGCAVAAALGVINPLDTAMAIIHAHYIPHDTFVVNPIGPASEPKFPKEEIKAEPACAAALEAGDGPESPPSWDCVSWAKIKDRIPTPRLGVLSVSTGLISEVDKGSETMRYLGNARFTVEMVRKVAGTTPKYNVEVKYIPVVDTEGQAVDSIDHISSKLKFALNKGVCPEPSVAKATRLPIRHSPHTAEMTFPRDAGDEDDGCVGGDDDNANKKNDSDKKEDTTSKKAEAANENNESEAAAAAAAAVATTATTTTSTGAVVAASSPSTSSPKWRVLTSGKDSDRSYVVMVCNICLLARDCCFAPFARCNDGALDVVMFSGKMGKVDLTSALLAMEDGTHIEGGGAKENHIKYIKCKEVEVRVSSGLLMCDGEVIPQCPVRMKMMPRSIKMIRTTFPF